MSDELELLEDVLKLNSDTIREYIRERAETIVENTQGDSWDDPEEWQSEAVELAHAVHRLFKEGVL